MKEYFTLRTTDIFIIPVWKFLAFISKSFENILGTLNQTLSHWVKK